MALDALISCTKPTDSELVSSSLHALLADSIIPMQACSPILERSPQQLKSDQLLGKSREGS